MRVDFSKSLNPAVAARLTQIHRSTDLSHGLGKVWKDWVANPKKIFHHQTIFLSMETCSLAAWMKKKRPEQPPSSSRVDTLRGAGEALTDKAFGRGELEKLRALICSVRDL